MSRTVCLWICGLLAVSLLAGDMAHAQRRRFRLFRRQVSNNDGTIIRVAPTVDPVSNGYRRLGAYFDYNRAQEVDPSSLNDRLRIFLQVRDPELLERPDDLVAELRVTDLADHESTHVRFVPVSFQESAEPDESQDDRLAVLDVLNEPGVEEPLIRPARVYRVFVNVHRKAPEYGDETALGRVSLPYYTATAGETRLQKARQQIVMRTFKEYYYRKQGWRSEENYSMDCYAYYMWATGFCTIGAHRGRTNLGRLFGRGVPYHHGGQIAEICKQGQIHGDYVRKPGHSFMLLSYNPKLKQVWTMEGNFNSTVEVVVRSISSGWTVGHLVEDHIRDELFADTAARSEEETGEL